MDWVAHAVASFGDSVNMPGLALDQDGCALFTVESDGVLSLQDLQVVGGNDVLISLARPLPPPHAPNARRALTMAHFKANPIWDTQLALRGGALVVTLRMPRHSFMLSALEEAVESLFSFHARLEQSH